MHLLHGNAKAMFVGGSNLLNHRPWLRFVDEDRSKSPQQSTLSHFWMRGKSALLRRANTGRTPLVALVDQAVVSGTNLLTAVMVGRFCGREGLGWFTLGMSTLLLANSVQGSLITTPYTIFLRRQESGQHPQRYAGRTLLGFCALVSALTLTAFLFALVYQAWPAAGAQHSLVWAIVVTIPCFLMRDFARRYDFAHMNMAGALFVDIGVAATQLSLLLTFGLKGRLSASVALALVASACAAMAFIWLIRRRREFDLSERWQLTKGLQRDWIFGRWLLLDQLIGIGQINAIYWLLVALINASATGVLAACATIAALPNPIFFGIGNYLAPRFADTVARCSYADTMQVYRFATIGLGIAVSVFTVIASVFGNDLLWLFYRDPAYNGLGFVVGLLAVRLALAIPTIAANHAIVAMEGPRGSAAASFLGLLAIIGVATPVIPIYGVMGAAIALLAGATVESAVTLVVFVRYLRRWQWTDVESNYVVNPPATAVKIP